MQNSVDHQGMFSVIDSFAIRSRNEFHLIGELTNGKVQPNWFVCIPFNTTIGMTVRIKSVEDVEFSDQRRYKLIIITSDEEQTDLLLALNIGLEYIPIQIEGAD